MAKVTIELPEQFLFTTEVDVLIQHINRANHLANENVVALLNEARMRFIGSLNFSNSDINPQHFINADLAVIYKSEAHHGDKLTIDVAANDFNRYGCDFVYRISQKSNGAIVAIAKMAMLHYDYENNCLSPVNEQFEQLFAVK